MYQRANTAVECLRAVLETVETLDDLPRLNNIGNRVSIRLEDGTEETHLCCSPQR